MVHTYFAAVEGSELSQILAIIAGMLVGFYGVFKIMNTSSTKERELERKERKEQNAAFVKALKDVAKSNQEIARATEKGNREAEKRNGHLAELTIQSKNDTLDAIKHLKTQHVDKQIVKHEHVENKE